ncbi:MAG: flavin oxidoreductase [Elusimicrobia bacterium RIFOXYB2_FULL_48_7]|nr:MAG: flavin oxidoreductase [Elusimicrobia bacterium RIFOXYB2_FULL_48_7]
MEKMPVKIQPVIKPMPLVIVSCCNKDGKNNALVVGYCCNCSYNPPMVMAGIVPSRYSYPMIKETGEFVVNLVGEKNKEAYDYLGKHSGRDGDKLAELGLKVQKGSKISAPIILDFPINIECKVIGSLMTGSHEMFAGRIEYIHASPEYTDKDGNIDYSKIKIY